MKLLYVNKNINLSKPIVRQLKELGFDVDILIKSTPQIAIEKSFFHRACNIFYRVVLRDKNYFIKKQKKLFEKYAEQQLKNEKYDIAFFIRADMYSERLIKNVRRQTKKMVSYQWDGLEMYPRIFGYYKYFDRKLVFDGNDIRKFPQYNLLPLPIYHYTENILHDPKNEEIDLFYIGVGLEERIKMSYNIEKYCKIKHLKFKAILTVPEFRDEVATESVSLQHKGISLEENEQFVSKSKAVVDFKMDSHNGVAFRFFECLNQEQKFVSNNHNLKNYDFYHPDNIFITDFEDFTGLDEFLAKPYRKVDREIADKYGIKNWLNYALDYGEYKPIQLP